MHVPVDKNDKIALGFCSIEGCYNRSKANTLCWKHYMYNRVHGYPEMKNIEILGLDIPIQEKTWLACAIDGEGCISVTKQIRETHTAYWINLQIGNTSLDFINEVIRITGYDKMHVRKRNNYKILYSWEVTDGYKIKSLLKTVEPYLIIKRIQANLILKWPLKNSRNVALRDEIYAEMRLLNNFRRKEVYGAY